MLGTFNDKTVPVGRDQSKRGSRELGKKLRQLLGIAVLDNIFPGFWFEVGLGERLLGSFPEAIELFLIVLSERDVRHDLPQSGREDGVLVVVVAIDDLALIAGIFSTAGHDVARWD